MADEFKRLDLYLAQNGPLGWQPCLKSFGNFLKTQSDTIFDGTDSKILTTGAFEIKSEEGNIELKLKYPEPEKSIEEDGEKKKESSEESSRLPDEAYMSPEHLLEAELDERSQIYSLGCIIYECIAGKPPFDNKKAKKLAENHIAFEPRPISKLCPTSLPDCVSSLIHKCIAKDPDNRFESLEELCDSLSALEEAAAEEEEVKKSVEPKVRNPKPLYVSGSIMLIFTFIIVATIYLTDSKEFKAYIYNSQTKNKNQYFLSIEDSNYRLQMDFKDGKLKPSGNKIPITIKQCKTGKILFATTQKETIKEALEEAFKRGLKISNGDFQGCDLKGINLEGAYLAQSNFSGADLKGANLSHTVLRGSRFWRTNLDGATIVGTKGEQCDFLAANCPNANFQNAFLPLSNLAEGNFQNADFSNAIISGSKVINAKFDGAKLSKVHAENIDWMDILTPEQKKQANESQIVPQQPNSNTLNKTK